MSNIVRKTLNKAKQDQEGVKQDQEQQVQKLLKLIEEHRDSKNVLKQMADELRKLTEEYHTSKTSFSFPKPFEPLLTKLKKEIGPREIDSESTSLMIQLAILEFVNRHTENPQPNLETAISGIEIPSTVKADFTEEFLNELRNLPQDKRLDKLLKREQYLLKNVLQRGSVQQEKQEKETEEKEKKDRKLVQTREQEQYKKYVKALKYVQHYMDKGRLEKAQAVINDIPLNKLRKQHRSLVQDWQETIKKQLEQLEEPIQLREIPEEDNDIELKPQSAASKDEIFGEEYLKYMKRITDAEKQLEQGNHTKAKTLVKNLNITDAPGDRLADRLRKIKEELGVKYG